MAEETFKSYRYRWLVLLAFIPLAAMTQVLWITFAPVTSAAAEFYGKSDLMIGLLSMSFMIVYIVVFLPAAWAIDTWGFKRAVGFGAVLTAVFGLTRGIFASRLHPRFPLPGRARHRAAVRHGGHHQARRALVPGRGEGNGLRPGNAGPISWAARGDVPDARSRPAPRDVADAPHLRDRLRGRRRPFPSRRPGAPAHSGRARGSRPDVRRARSR